MLDIKQSWYKSSFSLSTLMLLPFSYLFGACASMRRLLYRIKILKSYTFKNVPIIVVGNITVGGTGKTPFVIWLADFLNSKGYKPGIVSRGVGGKAHLKPYVVNSHDQAATVGDEALLLQQAGYPVVIGVKRVLAVEKLLAHSDCNVVLSDDGLQHYRLNRDMEIALIDGMRKLGNKRLLPAGPLRESPRRLKTVDFILVNDTHEAENNIVLAPTSFVSLKTGQAISIHSFPLQPIHAVAGIGNPARFFNTLQALGLKTIEHVYRDHYLYQAKDLHFNDNLPIVMTEKDAVKCKEFADERYWYLKVDVKVNIKLEEKIIEKLSSWGVR
ncbi:MAG: tetraacyldisaccharide 4'-kinase [Gammaproteobacteria bacterium RIFCSPHIGHO2_12_FULL_38_14]|nr:MAG: tetraacyldisaccharide 4'-kinase [Gammaproteobacteria bacterium RIFCSPHIGHO2_12_FULL_38_14]